MLVDSEGKTCQSTASLLFMITPPLSREYSRNMLMNPEGVNTKKDQHEKRTGSGQHEKRSGSGQHEKSTGSGQHEKRTGSGPWPSTFDPWPLPFDLNTKKVVLNY